MSTAMKNLEQCIENCTTCHRICLETVAYCLEQGGKHTEPNHMRLMLDCVEICQTSANFMIRGSERHVLTCRACAAVCEECARDCEKMSDDAQMQRCAEVCRTCASSCHEMSA